MSSSPPEFFPWPATDQLRSGTGLAVPGAARLLIDGELPRKVRGGMSLPVTSPFSRNINIFTGMYLCVQL